MTLMKKDGKPSMTSIFKVSPHTGGNQFCLLNLNPNKLLIVSESWVSTYKLEVVFPMNGSPFSPRLETMESALNGEITRNYKTKQQFINFLRQCGIQPDPEHHFNIRKLFKHGMTAAWLPYPKISKTNSGTGSRSEEELKVNRSSDGMKLREKIALTFDKALMLMGHDIAQNFTWDDLLGVVDILIDFINGNGATDTFNFDLLGMAFTTAQWNGLRDISNFFDAVKEVAFYSPAPWIGEALDPIAKSLTTSTNYIGLDYLLGFLIQYGNKGIKSYWPNGMDLIKKFVNNNNVDPLPQITALQFSTANKEKDSLSTSNAFNAKDRDNIRNILMIHKALDQAGFYFPDLSQEIMRAAVNINSGPVKFEFDLRDPIEIQTKDGGEAKIKIKGDITFTKNGKEIQLNYGNTSLSLTHLTNGEEEEIKQKLDKSNSLVQSTAIEFEKTRVKISCDKLWSILNSDGTTFSQGTHQEGDKVYLRFKYESPELAPLCCLTRWEIHGRVKCTVGL